MWFSLRWEGRRSDRDESGRVGDLPGLSSLVPYAFGGHSDRSAAEGFAH
jgi:hypothetical protein